MLQLAAVVAAVFGVAVLRVVVAEAVVFAVLRFFGALSVAPIAFVAATLRVDRGISLSAAAWGGAVTTSNRWRRRVKIQRTRTTARICF